MPKCLLLVITTVKHPKLVSFFVLFCSPISLHILSFNQLGVAYDLIFPYAFGYNYLCFFCVKDLFVHSTYRLDVPQNVDVSDASLHCDNI